MSTNELFKLVASQLPEGAGIDIHVYANGCGMVMHGTNENEGPIGEFGENVLGEFEDALLDALKVCLTPPEPPEEA